MWGQDLETAGPTWHLVASLSLQKRRGERVWPGGHSGPELGGIQCAHKSGNHEWVGPAIRAAATLQEAEGSGSRAWL